MRQSQSPDLVSSLTPDISLTRQIHLLKAKAKTNIYKTRTDLNRQGDHYHPEIGDKGRNPVVGETQSHRQSQVNSFDKMRLYNRPNQIDNPLDFAIILAGVEKLSQTKVTILSQAKT